MNSHHSSRPQDFDNIVRNLEELRENYNVKTKAAAEQEKAMNELKEQVQYQDELIDGLLKRIEDQEQKLSESNQEDDCEPQMGRFTVKQINMMEATLQKEMLEFDKEVCEIVAKGDKFLSLSDAFAINPPQ